MPTNRPFFANFFSAFRARTSPTFQAKSSSTSPSTTFAAATAQLVTSPAGPITAALASSPRTISTKAASEASQPSTNHNGQPSNTRQNGPSPFSATAAVAISSHTHSHPSRYPPPLSRSPGTSSPLNNRSFSPSAGSSTPYTSQARERQRRGSDSSNSSGGFMDALGHEKWYIGGRTAGGEERFYRLGLVTGGSSRRVGSADRLSL